MFLVVLDCSALCRAVLVVIHCTSCVSGKVSSEVTKVPLAELRKLFCHGVKVVGVHGEEGQEKGEEVRGEVKKVVGQLRDNRTCAWREDGLTDSRNDLSQCGV